MKKRLISFFIFGAIAIDLQALSVPTKSVEDNRIRFAEYSANDVFNVYGKLGSSTLIKFQPDERVTNLSSGFPDGWEIKDRENNLFISPKAYTLQITDATGNKVGEEIIKPNKDDWKTNLIVTTSKRDYLFELNLANNEVYYKLSFNYPADKLKEELEKKKVLKEKEEKAEIEDNLNTNTVPRNWDFYMNVNKGSEDIRPNYAYDDGVFTYLGFDKTKTFPSVFMYENEKESILNTHVKKDGKFDVLVIHNTTPMILLRSGNKLVGILNKGYAKNPLDETRATTNNEIKREVIKDGN